MEKDKRVWKDRDARQGPPDVASATNGEPRLTFAALYQAHAQAVARWAARLAGPGMEAEDVVQEVFMIAHRQLATFRGDSSPSTWLFGITQNVVRHRRRKESLRRWLAGAAEDPSMAAPPRPTPIEEMETREATKTVYKALDGMGAKYRTVFVLFEIDGLSGREISELTGLNMATIRVQLLRARAQFAQKLRAIMPKEKSAPDGMEKGS